MKSLGEQFMNIMKSKSDDLPMDRIAQVYVDKTLDDTLSGEDPSGVEFIGYAPSTAKKKGRTSPVTMRDKDLSMEGLDFQLTDDEAQLFFPEKGDIFDMHQRGTARGGNVRRIFPEEVDHQSANMENSYEKVGRILEEHFNA